MEQPQCATQATIQSQHLKEMHGATMTMPKINQPDLIQHAAIDQAKDCKCTGGSCDYPHCIPIDRTTDPYNVEIDAVDWPELISMTVAVAAITGAFLVVAYLWAHAFGMVP